VLSRIQEEIYSWSNENDLRSVLAVAIKCDMRMDCTFNVLIVKNVKGFTEQIGYYLIDKFSGIRYACLSLPTQKRRRVHIRHKEARGKKCIHFLSLPIVSITDLHNSLTAPN
jgi:hypothetical protein